MREALEAMLSILLGLVFIASAIPKLRRPRHFAVTVLAYDVLPPTPGLALAHVVPFAEMVLGVFLLIGVWDWIAGLLALALLSAFATAVGINVVRGRDIDCGCFGKERKIGARVLAEDVVLVCVALGLTALAGNRIAIAPWSPASVVSLSGLGAGICCFCIGLVSAMLVRALGRKRPGSRLPAEARERLQT